MAAIRAANAKQGGGDDGVLYVQQVGRMRRRIGKPAIPPAPAKTRGLVVVSHQPANSAAHQSGKSQIIKELVRYTIAAGTPVYLWGPDGVQRIVGIVKDDEAEQKRIG